MRRAPEIIVMLVNDTPRFFCPHCGGERFAEGERAIRWSGLRFPLFGTATIPESSVDVDSWPPPEIGRAGRPSWQPIGWRCQTCTKRVSVPAFVHVTTLGEEGL